MQVGQIETRECYEIKVQDSVRERRNNNIEKADEWLNLCTERTSERGGNPEDNKTQDKGMTRAEDRGGGRRR